MIYNPKEIFEKDVVSIKENIDYIFPIIDSYIQQNGIDIDCDKLFEVKKPENAFPFIGKQNSIKSVWEPILPIEHRKYPNSKIFILEKGKSYTFDSSFGCNLPDNICAEIVGRSTLNRQGILIRSSWYDSGFKCNAIGATIYCFNDIVIEQGARIAQIICYEASSAKLYQGQYQGK
jgi:deoxycytidine triphosphate deaminase